MFKMVLKGFSRSKDMLKRVILGFALCAIAFSALGVRPVAASAAVPETVAATENNSPVAASCQGWHGYGYNGNGWWASLNSCDVANLYRYGASAVQKSFNIPDVRVKAIVLVILASGMARIKAADRGRGVRIFQYWWVLINPPWATWMWAVEGQ